MSLGPKAQTIYVLCARIYVQMFYGICFIQMSMFFIHIYFSIYCQRMEDFCLFYALASMIFYSGSSLIVGNVVISDIFEIIYVF